MRMSASQQAHFDRAEELARQAAACSLYGCHAEAAHLWLMTAFHAVTLSGKKACLRNAHDEFAQVPTGGTRH